MSILYKAVKRNSSIRPDKPEMFLAVAKSRGEIRLDEIANDIAAGTTISQGDVYGVLVALCRTLPKALKNGYIVRLGKLGSFMITLQSEEADSIEEVTAKKVKGIRMRFRPSKELKKELNSYKLEKI